MLFSPIDPLWVGLIVLVLFVLIYGLCYYLNREAVKTGQKILIEQQESMSEKEKGLKRKRKKKGDTVLSGGQKGQDNRVEAEEEGELASAPPPYASSGEANENLTFILTSQMVTQVIEVMVSSPRGIVSILPGDQVDQVLTWARGSVCVFPQDQTEPLWVPERLVRRCKNERPDPVAPVDVVDDPTSTKDGAEMRDPFGIPEADTSST
ncbi:mCG54179, isoform CRA_b [Mus musculus]|nr:mCG54179, isoform CRA_b [Mus musculus]